MAEASRLLSEALDADGVMGDVPYVLEVSSPGLDRLLFSEEQVRRFRGHRARVRLAVKLDGQRNFEGVLGDPQGGLLALELAGEVRQLPLDQIDTIRLIPEL